MTIRDTTAIGAADPQTSKLLPGWQPRRTPSPDDRTRKRKRTTSSRTGQGPDLTTPLVPYLAG